MKIQNKSYWVNACTMLIGIGLQSMEHNIPGIIMILVGIIGIFATVTHSYWKHWFTTKKSVADLDKETGNTEESITNGLSFEIDHNLKLLHKFWENFQGFLSSPLSLSEGFRKNTYVVISQSPVEPSEVDSIESENLPNWHCKIFNMPSSLNSLSDGKQQNVRQFYDDLDAIASIYGKVIKFGNRVVRRTNLNERLEDLVTKVFEQGNPLKKHNQSLEPTVKAGSLS